MELRTRWKWGSTSRPIIDQPGLRSISWEFNICCCCRPGGRPDCRTAGLLLIIWGPRPHVLRSQLGPARWASPPSPHNRILVELQCCCERSTGPYRTINPLPAGKGSCCIPIAEAQRLAVDLLTTIIRHAVPENTLSTSIQPSFPSPCPTARPLIIIPFQPGSLPTTRLAKWP